MQERRIKEAIAFAKPYQPDAFLAVGELSIMLQHTAMMTELLF
jgi:hypothetical protein